MSKYRVGIVGTGGIARHHAGYYRANPHTEIVAGADINPENLDRFCEEQEVPAKYADYHEMLAQEQPEIVSVCTWQGSHPEITIAAAEAGARGVICEKPIGVDLAGPDAMIAACEERGVTLVAHHQTRYAPAFAAVKQAIADGAIGEPLGVWCTLMGGLLNIGSHSIDIVRYLLGDPDAKWVLGQAQRRTDRYERGALCEDLCMAIVALEGGARIQIDLDMPDTDVKVTRMVLGTEGRIELDGDGPRLLSSSTEGWVALPTESQPGFLEDFLSAMEGGPEHRCAIRHAMAAHEVMMALYESARVRGTVELPLANRGSALYDMVADGTLVAGGEAYDIRSEAAMRYYLAQGQ
jgi:predicted dehydrogenase